MKEEKANETQVRPAATRKEREPRKPRYRNVLLDSREDAGGADEGTGKPGEQLG